MGLSGKLDSDNMELNIWGGGWGLPSLDPESIQCLAAIRFAGAPAKINECNNPWNSANGRIPYFKKKDAKFLYSSSDIASYLRSKNYSSDYGLTSKQCAEVFAYVQYINEALHPALQYFLFIEETNFTDIIRPFYGRRLPWFYKMWFPERLKNEARHLMETIYPDAVMKLATSEPYILQKARRCITNLSEKLSCNEFFTPLNQPTTIDAVVFSYLAIFIKVPLPNNPIKEFIRSTPNLERYIARISLRYFPAVGVSGDSSSSRITYDVDGEVISSALDENSGFPRNSKMLAFLIATCVMIIYAFKNNMLHLPRHITDIPNEDDDGYWGGKD